MPIKSDGEVYFNITVYKSPSSGGWVAETMYPAGREREEGRMVDLYDNFGRGETPSEALDNLAADDPSDEAAEQIARAEEIQRSGAAE